jgi:hypothetical protein
MEMTNCMEFTVFPSIQSPRDGQRVRAHPKDVICAHVYSASLFSDNWRRGASFESISMLILDFDNKPGAAASMTLPEAVAAFKEYQHVIAPTKSHGKDGIDRFRVVLYLSSPITDAATYYATWYACAAKWPAVDQACKDTARGFYPSTGIESWSDSGELIEVVAPAAVVTPMRAPSDVETGKKGKLARSTLEILAGNMSEVAAKAGGRKVALYKAARDMHQNNYSLDEAIEKFDGNVDGLEEEEFLDAINGAYGKAPKHEPRGMDSDAAATALQALIMRSKLVVSLADPTVTTLVDLTKGETHQYHRDSIRQTLTKDNYATFSGSSVLFAEFRYDPRKLAAIHATPEGIPVYNTYVPPEWKRDAFFFARPLPESDKLPGIYQDFVNHLTGGKQESTDYILDWLSVSLTSRNRTLLTAIGAQGIGKGVLGHIMEKLHGSRNFVTVRDEVFKAKFNAPLKDKTLVYVDEADLRTKESQDRMKAVVNDTLEIEEKGKDSIQSQNYASFYLSSNTFDAVKIDSDDRRFSIVDLTDTKLKDTPLFGHIQALQAPANIRELAGYLLNREVTRNMVEPFRSERFEEVKEAGLSEWENWVIENWLPMNAGRRVPVADLQNAIKAISRFVPGRRKLQELANKYPDKMQMKKTATGMDVLAAGEIKNVVQFQAKVIKD